MSQARHTSAANIAPEKPCGGTIRISCNPDASARAWVREILATVSTADLKAVLIRLVIGLFKVRYRKDCIFIRTSEQRTKRRVSGDFQLGPGSYYVAEAATFTQIGAFKRDLKIGLAPVLIIPEAKLEEVYRLAERAAVHQRITIFGLERFVSQFLLFMVVDRRRSLSEIWCAVIREYNRQLENTSLPTISVEWTHSPSSAPEPSGKDC